MANFNKLSSDEVSLFKGVDCYQVTGPITMEEVAKINSSFKKAILIMQNTVGQNPSVIGYLNPDKVIFSVLGGLDYTRLLKYNEPKYIERTLYKPKQLAMIIREFETIEKGINRTWNDITKLMYIYNTLARSINYRRELDSGYGNGLDICWSLNGIVYKNSVCAGYSLILKEMLDRNNIECDYQSKASDYVWNVVRINDRYYGMDLTSDSVNNTTLQHFGTQDSYSFYQNPHREIVDSETTRYPLSVFSREELVDSYNKIYGNHKETHMDVLRPIRTNDNYRYLVSNLGSIEGVSYFLQASPPEINYFYAPDGININEILTRDNVEKIKDSGHILGDFSLKKGMPRFNKYRNSEGRNFIIFPKSARVRNGVKEYHIIESELVDGRPMLKRLSVSTENNLEMMEDEEVKRLIADILFDPLRLEKRVNDFDGYIGYIAPNSVQYFEQIKKGNNKRMVA